MYPLYNALTRILITLTKLSPFLKKLLRIVIDIFIALLSVWLAFSLRFESMHLPVGKQWIIYILAPMIAIPLFISSGLYRVVYRFNGFSGFIAILKAVTLYFIVFSCVLFSLNLSGVPHSICILQPLLFLGIIIGSRVFMRYWFSSHNIFKQKELSRESLLIYGSGSNGIELVNAVTLHSKYEIAGFIDDEKIFHGRIINGIKVYSPEQILEVIEINKVKNILVAAASLPRLRRSEIIEKLQTYPVNIRLLPSLEELAQGKVIISDVKKVEIEDLLGRDPIPCSDEITQQSITSKIVLVTGAGGSIGSELCLQLLALQPLKLLLIDNSEYSLFKLQQGLEQYSKSSNIRTVLVPLLCDVTDENSVANILRVFQPSIIYHAAAYKHVPMVEHNITAGIYNNVYGTLTLAQAAFLQNVQKFILVSTDKAVRPTNIMGASKRLCELILQALSNEQEITTKFSMVRFGNVLGSSGSVVPLFREQIKQGGPLTITHKDITRYFMTIPEAAHLVIQAGAMSVGGEVYLLDMGQPIKIIDLARRMVTLSGLTVRDNLNNQQGDIEIKITGLRSGEKLYEELLIGNNPELTTNPRIFKAKDQYIPWLELKVELTNLINFIQSNDINNIKQILKKIVPEYQTSTLITDYIHKEEECTLKEKTIVTYMRNGNSSMPQVITSR